MTASLTDVHRRLLTILLPAAGLLAVTSLSGCSTSSNNNDVAAQVNANELSPDELTELVTVVGTPNPTTGTVDPTSGDNVRGAIQFWVQVEVVTAALETAGTPVTDAQSADARTQLEGQLPNVEDLSTSTVDTLVAFLALRPIVGAQADQAAFVTNAAEAADVYVDPRFGTFDPVAGLVTPLGAAPAEFLPTDTLPTDTVPTSTTG